MSNLSDIGFPVQSEQDVNVLITETIKFVESIKCPHGFYLRFADASGAEIYLQGNVEQELVGFNPHFAGTSQRLVNLSRKIERDSSPLDGGFYCFANLQNGEIDSNNFPFVFDVPDFRVVPNYQLPQTRVVQLTAFASNDFRIFDDEQAFNENQEGELKFAVKSFIPSGLFDFDLQDDSIDLSAVRPIANLSGEIKAVELKTNELSGEEFYWFLVETLGGETDVVADVKLISGEPQIGGIVSGQFWLSGKIMETPIS